MSSKKYLKGKIAYQSHPEDPAFFVRQYEIKGDDIAIGDLEEGPFGPSVIPSDIVKQLTK